MGFSLLSNWGEPSNPNIQADYTARDNWLLETIGWFSDPLVTGDYPAYVREVFGDLLPQFSTNEMNALTGSFDFLAVEHFTTYLVCTILLLFTLCKKDIYT